MKTLKAIAAITLAVLAAIPLTATAAQAAPITRTTTCAKFVGDYTYWSDGTGWYGFSLTGTITRTCSGSAGHGITVTGDKEWGNGWYYDYYGRNLSGGQSVNIPQFYEPYSVKNIRISLS